MTTILIKKKDTAGAPAPGDLTNAAGGAEIAVNTATKRLYTKDSGGTVVELGTNPSALTTNLLFSPDATYDIGASGATRPRNLFLSGAATLGTALTVPNGGTGLTTLATGSLSYGAGTSAFSTLAIGTAGQILTSSGTAPQWSTLSGVAVTTFSAGTTGFTPSSATAGAVTLAGTLATTNGGTGLTSFTSGGVVYASSSSALATGSALTFDGNIFSVLSAGNNPVRFSSSSTSNTLIELTNSNASKDLISRFRQTNGGGNWWDLTMEGSSNAFTFEYNDGELLRITSAGNVGIGTSSPSSILQVVKSTAQTDIDSSAQVLLLENTATDTSGNLTGIRYRQSNGTNAGQGFIGLSSTGNGATRGSLVFAPPNTSGNSTERMRITSEGAVGIGVTNPGTSGYGGRLVLFNGASYPYTHFIYSTSTSQSLLKLNYEGGTGFTNGNKAGVSFGSDQVPNGSYAAQQKWFVGINSTADGVGNARLVFYDEKNSVERMSLDMSGNLCVDQTSTANGSGASLQGNLATGAVGVSGSFATVWTIPSGTLGIFIANLGGNGQYGGGKLFYVSYGQFPAGGNATVVELAAGGDQSGYSWSWQVAAGGQFQMRNNTNTAAFVPVISLLTLG